MKGDISEALRIYAQARRYVSQAGLDSEVTWQRSLEWEAFGESDLLRQCAWVILCGGFKEAVIRRLFDHISLCFCDWESAHEIAGSAEGCTAAALRVFRNKSKVHAIVEMAKRVETETFDRIKHAIHLDPIGELQKFSYIGPVTAVHLAKNLGMHVAKPDRHLVRLANRVGFRCAEELCSAIAVNLGEQINVVDLVLWRYLADGPHGRSQPVLV